VIVPPQHHINLWHLLSQAHVVWLPHVGERDDQLSAAVLRTHAMQQ
jgi:hypothetical protein